MRQLNIDPEFRDKIPPLSEDEFSKLEENIVSDGEVREPLVVWHNTICLMAGIGIGCYTFIEFFKMMV